jgi:carotenoid cleavage dioxygenase-like enzyme
MKSKYGIMNRNNKDAKEIKWFEFPNHYVYHYVNAWDSKNEKGEDIVTMFGCVLSNVNLEYKHRNPYDRKDKEHPFLWEA